LWGNLAERSSLKDLGTDGRIILKRIYETWIGGMDCTGLSHDRNMWCALLNAVINPRVT
jgi:hypothetical protein